MTGSLRYRKLVEQQQQQQQEAHSKDSLLSSSEVKMTSQMIHLRGVRGLLQGTSKQQHRIHFASKSIHNRIAKHITHDDDEMLLEGFNRNADTIHIHDKTRITILKRDPASGDVITIEIHKESTDKLPQTTHARQASPTTADALSSKRKRKRLPLLHHNAAAAQNDSSTASSNTHHQPASANASDRKKRKLSHNPPPAAANNGAAPSSKIPPQNSRTQKYTYTKLDSLSLDSKNFNVHVYGVIVEYTSPKPTSCNLHTITVTLTDSSIANKSQFSSNRINLLLSARLEKLPSIKMVGQIFRGHRMKVGEWKGNKQLVSTPQSDFLVLDPVNNPSLSTPPDSVPKNKTWEQDDFQHLADNSQLASRILTDKRFANNPRYLKRLSDLRPDASTYVDIIARIVSIEQLNDGLMVKIWDSTQYLDVGYVADVRIFQAQHPICDYLKSYSLGTWVKFRNFAFVRDRGLFTHRQSSVCVLPANHQDVVTLEQRAKEVFTQNSTQATTQDDESSTDAVPTPPETLTTTGLPQSPQMRTNVARERSVSNRTTSATSSHRTASLLPRISSGQQKKRIVTQHPHEYVPSVSLKQVYEQELCPAKFRVQVRVTGFDPTSINYFSLPFCPECDRSLGSNYMCAKCKSQIEEPVWHFRFTLIVACAMSSETTESMRVLVEREAGEKFLDMEARNLISDMDAREKLSEKVRFMQHPNHVLDICIEKYRSMRNRIIYRLADTTLKCT